MRAKDRHLNKSSASQEWKSLGDTQIFVRGSAKPIVEIKLSPQSGDECYIVNWGDWHQGSLCHDEDALWHTRQYILKHKLYVISPGIDPEMALKGSKSESYRLKHTPAEERKIAREFLEPVVKAGLLLGVTSDNHSRRLTNATGEYFMREILEDLGAPELYLGDQGYLHLHVADQTYKALVFHGKGGSNTEGGRMNSAIKVMRNYPEAELYFTGHLHHATAYDVPTFREVDGNLETRMKLISMCGSYLQYWGLYAEWMALQPGKMGAKLVTLWANEHRAESNVGGLL